jgi:hypothetical protein
MQHVLIAKQLMLLQLLDAPLPMMGVSMPQHVVQPSSTRIKTSKSKEGRQLRDDGDDDSGVPAAKKGRLLES